MAFDRTMCKVLEGLNLSTKAHQLLQSIDGALNAGFVIALVGELGGELTAGVRPKGQHACRGRFACIILLLQRRPAQGSFL